MLLIYPPVAKPSEPPAGVARLAGALNRYDIRHNILDANLEGMLYLLRQPHRPSGPVSDTWTTRSFRNRTENLLSLRERSAYHNFDRYKRTVLEVNRVLGLSSGSADIVVGLTNYEDRKLSPLRSRDLVRAAECPELNPFYPFFSRRISDLIEKDKPSLVGFSLNYLSQALCAFAMAGFIRQNFPGLKIVFGGGLVTSWMSNPDWKQSFGGIADHLVAGPGEQFLLSLAGIHEARLSAVTPDYSLLPLDDYLSPGRVLPYSASMGCYWRKCLFCPERAENNPYVPLPASGVVSDVKVLAGKTNCLLVHFLDNAMSISLMMKLSKGAGEIPWYGFSRISRELTDSDFCSELKRSGCVMLKLGLESGDQEVLDRMQKGIDLEVASRALKALRKAGIASYIYLLFGTPWETVSSARKTLEFIVKHRDSVGFLNLAVFNMPLCCPGAEHLETRSFYEADLQLYTDFVHPEGWGRKEVRSFLENDFKRQRDISFILKKDPPLFTSNHAPFFATGRW